MTESKPHPGSFPPPPVDDGANVDNPDDTEGVPTGFHAVESSNIKAVAWVDTFGHDLYAARKGGLVLIPGFARLLVIFQTGSMWEYDRVPFNIATSLLEARSVGNYFSENVRDIYDGRQLDPATLEPEE